MIKTYYFTNNFHLDSKVDIGTFGHFDRFPKSEIIYAYNFQNIFLQREIGNSQSGNIENIIGISMDGYINTFAISSYSETFKGFGIFSPTYWFNKVIFKGKSILKIIKSKFKWMMALMEKTKKGHMIA